MFPNIEMLLLGWKTKDYSTKNCKSLIMQKKTIVIIFHEMCDKKFHFAERKEKKIESVILIDDFQFFLETFENGFEGRNLCIYVQFF
jgi:hypothetical protein